MSEIPRWLAKIQVPRWPAKIQESIHEKIDAIPQKYCETNLGGRLEELSRYFFTISSVLGTKLFS